MIGQTADGRGQTAHGRAPSSVTQAAYEVRLITINTGKCDGPYFPRREALACQLRALGADVIALQEAFRSEDGTVDTAAYLARALGMHVAFAPARRKVRWLEGRDLVSASGMALLSRQPLTRLHTLTLPADPNDDDRVAQVAVLEIGSRTVALANIHTCHLSESGMVRHRQIQTVLAHPELTGPHAARILMGDLNATADAPELSPLWRGELGWDVRDAYLLGGGPPARATVARHTGWHGPRMADRCIDFILSLAGRASEHPEFQTSTVALNQRHAQTGVYPSDHFAVATTLLL